MQVVLIKDIVIGQLRFKTGQTVFVDFETLVAYANGVHFEIEKDEFAVLQ